MSDKTLKFLRLAALAALVGALFFAGTRPSVQAYFELEHLRQLTAESGVLGMVTFVGICAAGCLMQLPGLIFVIVALLAWGPFTGSAVAFVGLTAATSVNFWTLRTVGGSPLADVENNWVRKTLKKLDDKPIRTVVLLRTVFFVNPVVNLPLVLSGVKFRHYLIGSAIGIVAPLAAIAVALDTVMFYMT